MKKVLLKIVMIILCISVLFVPIVASAESTDTTDDSVVDIPEETPKEPTVEEEAEAMAATITEQIKTWILDRLDDISLVITIICSIVIFLRKNKAITKAMSAINNNAINIAKESASTVGTALTGIQSASDSVGTLTTELQELLAYVRQTAEEKERLASALVKVEAYLDTAKIANIEFADELKELLILSNIPNSVKDEIFTKHDKAVAAIEAASEVERVGEEA